MKPVLMIAAAFPPVNNAGVHRTARFARMLPEFGWEPVVLTSSPAAGDVPGWVQGLRVERLTEGASGGSSGDMESRPSAERSGEAARSWRALRWLAGVKRLARNVEGLLFYTPDRHVVWVKRHADEAVRLAREEGVEVVYTTGPPHSLHLLGLRLKRELGLPWVMDFRDPWARKPWGFKARNPWGQRLLGGYEGKCVRSANRVILNTERMRDEFRNHYRDVPAERFVAIPNGCDPELADRVEGLLASEGEQECGEDRVYRVCHAGSLYRERDPRPVVDAIGLLRVKGLRVRFEQVGTAAHYFGLPEYAKERGLSEWVSVEPSVAHAEALRRMAQADALLLVQPGTDLQVPGKLFEMLLFGKPIIALADEGATADIIKRYGLGEVVGEDAAEIAGAIERSMAQGCQVLSGCDAARRDFDGRRLTEALGNELEGVLPGHLRGAERRLQGVGAA